MSKGPSQHALRAALVYVSGALAAIALSAALVDQFVADPARRAGLFLVFCCLFAFASGALLFCAMRRCLTAWTREIEACRRTEAGMVKARAYYEQFLEIASDGIHVIGADGSLLEANSTFYHMLGYSAANPPALKVTDWNAEWSPEKLRDRMGRDLPVPETFETVHRCRDGRLLHVEITARRIQFRGESCVYACARDITGRKQAEKALRESQEKFSKIFQASPVALSVSTMAQGRYLDVNEEFLKLLQRSRADVVGRSALDLGVWVFPGQREIVIDEIRRCGSVRNFEIALRAGAGQVRQVLWSAELVVIENENCLIGTSLDITDRLLAERKLRESEERYRQLFDMESDALVLIDSETHRFLDVNQSAQQLYGYSRDEFLRMEVGAISAEPDLTRATIASGKCFIPLRWHRRKNGQRFAVEVNANHIVYQGRPTALCAVRDITVRQQVMEMLSETRDQLVEAQHIAGLGSFVFDIATGSWTASEVLTNIFGLTDPGAARDVPEWFELMVPDDRAAMQHYFYQEVLKQQRPFDHIYRIVRATDREVRWVHGLGKLIIGEHGQVERLVGVVQDITDKKRDEEQMTVQLSALSAAANAIVLTDRNGLIKWVNPAFSRLTGYESSEAVGRKMNLLKSGRQSAAFYDTLWGTILAGNVWHGELVNRRKDGQIYLECATITPVRGADGQIAHFVAILQDVTEQRELEKRMQQAQKMEAIGTLAGGIAHDFNNILAAMFGYTYLLQQDTEGNSNAQENIGEILKATSRAKELVQQILTFSRQREQKPELIHLETVVKEAIKFLRASLPAQIKIELNLAPDTPPVLADPTQIYQVVINLATNALHAMEGKPGLLIVDLDYFRPDEDFLESHPDFHPAPYARLTVADTGHGMDAGTLARIFEPFFTTKAVGKGTGLGLSVVHGIVQAHNGAITVDSEIGHGSTFRIHFPGQEKMVPPPIAADSLVLGGAGQSILLLDDEPSLTAALQRILLRLNYRVTTSNSARETVSLVRQNPARFDLVISDLTMPEMTGVEVARQLHSLRADLPIILASGFSTELHPDEMRAVGICELLEKPIPRNRLAAAVQRALALKQIPAARVNGHN